MLLDNLVKRPSLYREKTVSYDLGALLADDGLQTHPERHPRYDLEEDAAEAPHVDDPRICVFLNVLEQFGNVLELVLVEDEVEDLWGHVLGSGHGELAQIAKDKGTSVVNQLGLKDVALSLLFCLLYLIFGLQLNQNVLSLQVRVNYIVL